VVDEHQERRGCSGSAEEGIRDVRERTGQGIEGDSAGRRAPATKPPA
jgi:hypothetical protein